eukprot:361917-Chlamydomonas_euryale.AAC.5
MVVEWSSHVTRTEIAQPSALKENRLEVWRLRHLMMSAASTCFCHAEALMYFVMSHHPFQPHGQNLYAAFCSEAGRGGAASVKLAALVHVRVQANIIAASMGKCRKRMLTQFSCQTCSSIYGNVKSYSAATSQIAGQWVLAVMQTKTAFKTTKQAIAMRIRCAQTATCSRT